MLYAMAPKSLINAAYSADKLKAVGCSRHRGSAVVAEVLLKNVILPQ